MKPAELVPLDKNENDTNASPDILAICCEHCAQSAAALAGAKRIQYPVGVRIMPVPCSGNIEMEHVLDAFEKGVDGILVVGCLEGGCHFVEGNVRARKRVERLQALLDEIGVNSARLGMVNLSDAMASEFVESLKELSSKTAALGPNPLKSTNKKKAQE